MIIIPYTSCNDSRYSSRSLSMVSCVAVWDKIIMNTKLSFGLVKHSPVHMGAGTFQKVVRFGLKTSASGARIEAPE